MGITFDIKKVVKERGRSRVKYIHHTVLKDGRDYTEEYAKLWDIGVQEDGTVVIIADKRENEFNVIKTILKRVNEYGSKKEWQESILR